MKYLPANFLKNRFTRSQVIVKQTYKTTIYPRLGDLRFDRSKRYNHFSVNLK